MNRTYEEVMPVGYIVAGLNRYMLLHPEPLQTRDAWANGLLYFSVAKSGEYLDHATLNGTTVFTYSRQTLVIHPANLVMEIGYRGKPILVWTGEYEMGQSVILVPEETSFMDKLMFDRRTFGNEGENNE